MSTHETDNKPPKLDPWSIAGIALVAVAAALGSAFALYDFARRCYYPHGLEVLLPVTIDIAATVATRVWLDTRNPKGAREYAKRLVYGLVITSVVANIGDHVLATYGIVPPWPVVALVGAVLPIVLALMVHLGALMRVKNAPAAKPAVRKPARKPAAPKPKVAAKVGAPSKPATPKAEPEQASGLHGLNADGTPAPNVSDMLRALIARHYADGTADALTPADLIKEMEAAHGVTPSRANAHKILSKEREKKSA